MREAQSRKVNTAEQTGEKQNKISRRESRVEKRRKVGVLEQRKGAERSIKGKLECWITG